MNDRVREALVTAALNGTKQIKGAYKDRHGGRCALGVIMEHAGLEFGFTIHPTDAWHKIGLTPDEFFSIQRANDNLGWDFLIIARKIGTPEYDEALSQLTEEDVK
jgi:hypothetical protein